MTPLSTFWKNYSICHNSSWCHMWCFDVWWKIENGRWKNELYVLWFSNSKIYIFSCFIVLRRVYIHLFNKKTPTFRPHESELQGRILSASVWPVDDFQAIETSRCSSKYEYVLCKTVTMPLSNFSSLNLT